jgi:hypothetical protein
MLAFCRVSPTLSIIIQGRSGKTGPDFTTTGLANIGKNERRFLSIATPTSDLFGGVLRIRYPLCILFWSLFLVGRGT